MLKQTANMTYVYAAINNGATDVDVNFYLSYGKFVGASIGLIVATASLLA